MKNKISDLAIFGGNPLFEKELHVGRPNIGNKEVFLNRVGSILDNKWLTNNGPYVQELEKKINHVSGTKHCIAICNATVALEIAIRAMGLTGEVIVPSFTFIATAHALQWQEITPVFCDIDPVTHNIDPEKIESMITPKTTGIIGVHLWGRPCNVDAIEKIARKHNLKVLFDAAHAFGCTYKNKPIGGFGNAEVFSFHATKFINSLEGGAVVTNDEKLAQKIRLMKNFGFIGYDNVNYIGTNGKMNEVSAAMGITSIECMGDFININKENYEIYKIHLSKIDSIKLIEFNSTQGCNYQYVVLEINDSLDFSRDMLQKLLVSENILARRYFFPGCHKMEPYRSYYPHFGRLLPETEALSMKILSLPTGTQTSKKDIEKICQFIQYVYTNRDEISLKLQSSHNQAKNRDRMPTINYKVSNKDEAIVTVTSNLKFEEPDNNTFDQKDPNKKTIGGIVILDDIFPHLLSAFRIAEFNYYLGTFQNSKVYSTASAFPLIKESRTFTEVYKEYESLYPQFSHKVFACDKRNVNLDGNLTYAIFLNNIYSFLDIIETQHSPFIFTLYPGGGFEIDQKESDRKLRRVFSSPYFRKVIVTQTNTYKYLIQKKLCGPGKIEFIYGGVLPTADYSSSSNNKKHYKIHKETFDICFVANKYTYNGRDKGYDIFIEVAKRLSKSYKNIKFHVVGGFDETVIDVSSLKENITYYGYQYTDFFKGFYTSMDLILSPNIPFVLGPGAFDGFPTGACIEAGLNAVPVFCTDELQMNVAFKNNEIVIISNDPDDIFKKVQSFYLNPEKLQLLSKNVKIAFQKAFNIENQMTKRIAILEKELQNLNNQKSVIKILSEKNPLVSISIPAYNPQFFEIALKSATEQTYDNIEIIICDDSRNNDIYQITKKYESEKIRYFKNADRMGSYENLIQCFRKSKGEFIKFLNDDDLLLNNCVFRMAQNLQEFRNVTLVTSHRKCIDKFGNLLGDFSSTAAPVHEDSIIDGITCGNLILNTKINFIGEPTTTLFRRSDLEHNQPNILSFAGRPITWNSDVAMWLTLLSRGDLIYLTESLSCFRLHEEQEQRTPQARSKGIFAWRQLVSLAKNEGFLSNDMNSEIKLDAFR